MLAIVIVPLVMVLASSAALATEVIVVSDLPYASGSSLTLDIYRPSTPAAGHPVVIFLYGGAWQTGKKSDYKFVGETLAQHGIVTVIPDARGYPEVTFPTFLQDAAAAVAWTARHIAEYDGNAKDIFLMGHSSGAYDAAMLALDPDYLSSAGYSRGALAGMIGLAGPYNPQSLSDGNVRAIFASVGDPDTVTPESYVDGHNPPLLLLAGQTDETVPPSSTNDLAQKIEEHHGNVQVKIYPATGHLGIILPFSPQFHGHLSVVDDVVSFVIAQTEKHT